jgi:hypothetical protein
MATGTNNYQFDNYVILLETTLSHIHGTPASLFVRLWRGQGNAMLPARALTIFYLA